MGLLDALRQYIADALPGGLLNPETKPVANQAKYIGGLLDPNSPISQDTQNWHKRTQIGLADQLAGRQTPEAEQAYQTMMQAAGIAPVGMVKGSALSAQEALEAAKKLTSDAKRVVNPEVWDDSLGGAAWYDRRTPGVYHAIHMTDDPSRAGKAIKSGKDVKESYAAGDAMAQMNSEMGKGLYVSGREDMWKHRGSKKIPVSMAGDFLELERYPYSNSDALQALGFDGAFIRGGMGGVPQTVIWNNDAIKSFGKFSR